MSTIPKRPASEVPGAKPARGLMRALRRVLCGLPLRDIVAALLLAVAATIAQAEEHVQDWIPDVLEMPEDAEVLTDRAIGSSVRLFSITTDADVEALFAGWEDELRENGYQILQGDAELLERSIEFSGHGITNAKIILSPAEHGDRSLIEFDATLD